VARADNAEVAAVKRCDFGGVEPLRCGDHRSVDGTERQVAVLGDELRDANGVTGMQRLGVDVGIERARIDDQRDGAISEARISSIRSEMSLWPLRPLAAAARRRPPARPEVLLEARCG